MTRTATPAPCPKKTVIGATCTTIAPVTTSMASPSPPYASPGAPCLLRPAVRPRDGHRAALGQVATRLAGILHGCLNPAHASYAAQATSAPMGGGLAAGDVWLPTRTDGLLWLRGGIVYVAWRRRHMRAVVQCPAYAGLILGGRAVCARHGGQRSLFFPPGRLPGADPVPGSAGVDDDLPAVPGGVVGLEPDAADCACVVAEVLIGAWLPDDRLEG